MSDSAIRFQLSWIVNNRLAFATSFTACSFQDGGRWKYIVDIECQGCDSVQLIVDAVSQCLRFENNFQILCIAQISIVGTWFGTKYGVVQSHIEFVEVSIDTENGFEFRREVKIKSPCNGSKTDLPVLAIPAGS